MDASTVYFTNLRTEVGVSRLTKLERLLRKAGIGTIDFKDKYVAIKIHFGEPGNLAFLRPNYAATVVSLVKELGGKPFLTDCNTLYVGGRKNALDHLDSAYQNGYSPFSTGCHILIADGLKGTDEVLVPVEGGVYVKEAKIGRALMDADIVISLNHFKGHEGTGFGGALKNLGMGGGSRAGKMEMHSAGKPHVDTELCIGCGRCAKVCAHDAPDLSSGKAVIDHDRCVGCGRCIGVCPKDAVLPASDESNDILNCKIAEYAKAIVDGRPNFHINIVIDISPYCDCHGENDLPIVPDVGMFASFDPVALDIACADAVNAQPVMPGSHLEEMPHSHHDHFTDSMPATNWRTAIDHAQAIGLGSANYKLVTVK
ncbi:MAG: DUF362 domain-containing protein [Sphaerochaetaceae bacterium]|jgi:uncharacterized Fe-S center protein